MIDAVIMADHEIGYTLTNFMLQSNFKIKKIYTSSENDKGWWKSLQSLCKDYKIKVEIFDPQFALEELTKFKFDYLFLLSWKYILKPELIHLAKKGTINLHYSLLPSYRGVYPINQALIHGEKETGVTFHWVNEKIDAGNIILQEKCKIDSFDTTDSLLKKLNQVAFSLFKRMVNLENEWHNAQEQKGEKSYFSQHDFKETNELNLEAEMKVFEVLNLIRGKSFAHSPNNLYFIDNEGNKVFVSINLKLDENPL